MHNPWSVLLPSVALVYFVYIWELAVGAHRTKGYSIPLWLDAVGVVGIVVGQLGVAGRMLQGGPWWAPSMWLWISASGFILLIVAVVGVRRKVSEQATQIVQGAASAIGAPELTEAEQQRLTGLKRRSSIISIVGGLAFLICWAIGFGTADLASKEVSAFNVGLIAGGPFLGLIALVWTALLHRHIRRIEGNKKPEASSWWNW